MSAADWREDRIGSAIDGRNPTVLAELTAAFAVIGDSQFLPGYCLALTKTPGVDRLSDLDRCARLAFLSDVDLLASAVETVCSAVDSAFRRVNIEILGNTHPMLHAHVWPRYEWEPHDAVGMPVWCYPRERWSDPASVLSSDHDELRSALRVEITRLDTADRAASGDRSAGMGSC
ncbi:HIT family protein [Gordonia humi]|uniref:Diadenosine tetraphosphate (Ap4A) HIT family hydrolase n=1 Tax=Gordonia humi TaxID=686429 RepID=A0A840F3X7_9ACTN|nr:HIT domain-containing protein [Gordonia humi]MBB4137354.1 diadenosine tetraphosphate (Ap4A) HIT family hydrolase [Gordonia humi]